MLERKLQRFFAEASILRGESYYQDRAVMGVRIGIEAASAEVIGSEIYHVSLDWKHLESGEIAAHCTCPHFSDGNKCKHLWAFILHLDHAGVPPAAALRGPVEMRSVRRVDIVDPQTSPAGETPTPARIDWRRVFKEPAARKARGTSHQEVFVVLEASSRDENEIKFAFFTSERAPGGQMGGARPLTLPPNGEVRAAEPALQSAIKSISTLALGELSRQDSYSRYRYFSDPATRLLALDSARFILSDLLQTGKVYASKSDFIRSHQLREDLSLKSARFQALKLQMAESGNDFLLSATVEFHAIGSSVRGSVNVHELQAFSGTSLFRLGNYLGFLELADEDKAWFRELAGGPLVVPGADSEAFLETVINQKLEFELPQSLRWERVQLQPEIRLELTLDKSSGLERYWVDLKFQYGTRTVSYWFSSGALASLNENKIYLRDRVDEDKIFARLPAHLMLRRRQDEGLAVHARNLNEFAKLALAAGFPLVIDNKKLQEATFFQINVTSGVDWFDVEGQAGFSGRWIKFPALLESITRGEKFIPLPDGSVGLMSDEMIQRLEKLTTFADTSGKNLRFGAAQGVLLSSLLEDEDNLNLDAKFQGLRDKIRGFAGIAPLEPVASFNGQLRAYQREGLGWLEFLQDFGLGGILADDMGLGKTIQCLAFLEGRRARRTEPLPSLLMAPKTVLENWRNEAAKFTPKLKVLLHVGTERKGSTPKFGNYDLIVTTYHTMLRDLELLKVVGWDCIVIDEAQAIKNPGALISRAVKALPAQFRLAMTGTPIENSLQDLFSISDFVNPGFLNGRRRSAHLKLNDETRELLGKAFKPVVLRRTKDRVLKDLPEKTEQTVYVELEAKQLKAYNELKRYYQGQLLREVEENGINKSQIQILAALTRLRQAALHPGLIDPALVGSKSAKFELLVEMLTEIIAEGHRVLIFSQFTTLLALLKKELSLHKMDYRYLDGQTNKRQAVVDEFKTSDCPIFLMSLKAGGVGLNLVEANYVFLLDPWWNPAVEAQAIDRVHRIGQRRAVNAYRIIAKNTVEEKILELQATKRSLSHDLLGQKANPIRGLSAEDIENLFT